MFDIDKFINKFIFCLVIYIIELITLGFLTVVTTFRNEYDTAFIAFTVLILLNIMYVKWWTEVRRQIQSYLHSN